MKTVSRRIFIKNSAFFACAISIPVFGSCNDKQKDTPSPTDACETTSDILGPYYKKDAPLKENIIPANSEGIPLIISGKVYSECSLPLKDAVVDIWNADENGEYDMSDNFLFRGRAQTSANGSYTFKTIIPGRYLNGDTFRPSHIHFKITAPNHIELVSQVYFKDDPYLSKDPWASAPKAKERILSITKDSNGIDIVNFDIHLNKA